MKKMSKLTDSIIVNYHIERFKKEDIRFLSAKEVATRTRFLIRIAKIDGILPHDLKVSVRSEYFAGGQAVDIRWKTGWKNNYTNKGTKVFTLVDVGSINDFTTTGRRYEHVNSRYYIIRNERYDEIEDLLNEIVKLWQIDNSNLQIDYFSVNYWARVNYDGGKVDYNLDTLDSTVLNSGELNIFTALYNDDPYNANIDELVTMSKLLDQDTTVVN
jgi:hypothetical protein